MATASSQPIIPFKAYLNQKMAIYKAIVPGGIALFFAILTAALVFIQYADSNRLFVESIAPHVAALIETQDRPELQRFLRAVSGNHGSPIEVIQNGEIIASTLDTGRIGRPFEESESELRLLDLKKINGQYVSFTEAKRTYGHNATQAQVGIYLNMGSIIHASLTVATTLFLLLFLLINLITYRVAIIADKSLEHLEELEGAIRDTQESFDAKDIPSFPILELENIRQAFVKTKEKLKASNEKIAKSKAREMASFAYKNLIHDLNVPVTALRNHLKIMGLGRATEEDKKKALSRIVDLAEQVLRQVKSARSHLTLDEANLSNSDLVESVRRATFNAQMAFDEAPNVDVVRSFPKEELFKPHDPNLLGRAISNLVSNAIEAASSLVNVEIINQDKGVSIKISDDGKGMSQDEVSLHLQGRGRSTKSERKGIGLASANHIVRSHGGKIIYQTSPYGGACFEVRLEDSV